VNDRKLDLIAGSLPAATPEPSSRVRRAKIVCTIGPACDSEEFILDLMRLGMDVARLNFSHGTHPEHARRIQRLRRAARSSPRRSSGNSTLANAVFHGSSVGSWNTMPTLPGIGPQTRSPSMRASPLLAAVRPARIASSVDLPQPLGPTSVTNRPLSTVKDTSSSARSGARPALNSFARLLTSMIGI